MKHVFYAFALVAFLCAGIASPAAAAKMSFPDGAAVGFSFDLPEGWTTHNDDANKTLVVRTPGETAAVMILTVIDDKQETGSLEDVARAALEVAKAAPYTKEEDTDISGVPGKAFLSTMSSNGVDFNLRMSIFKIGSTFLSATEATQVTMTEEQQQQLATLGLAINGGQ
ncbi:MAG: hypothetical protein EPN97_06540 [Alphaproteobacteria bacterium]|nr:MAG: hypothetical protein EPN97_06540 [Alphaproteobacteria bacterium]